jgi:hypothetical protein
MHFPMGVGTKCDSVPNEIAETGLIDLSLHVRLAIRIVLRTLRLFRNFFGQSLTLNALPDISAVKLTDYSGCNVFHDRAASTISPSGLSL